MSQSLEHPTSRRRFRHFGPREAHAADQAISPLQCDREAPRTTGCVVLPHECDPLSPVRFGVRMRHGRDPAGNLPSINATRLASSSSRSDRIRSRAVSIMTPVVPPEAARG